MTLPKKRGDNFICAEILLGDTLNSDADDEYTVPEQTNLN